MHCPNCGTKASARQKFCRACGFGLENVEQLIADQKAAATDQTTGATGGLSGDRLRKIKKWAARAIFALSGVLGIWVIMRQEMIFEGSIVLLILAGAVLGSFLAYLVSERKKSASPRSNQQHPLRPAAETAKTLSEPSVEMAASVTENTTARLEEKIEAPIKSLQ